MVRYTVQEFDKKNHILQNPNNMSKTLTTHLNLALKTHSELRKKNLSLKAIFDLDSTLFDVSPRISRILNELGEDPHWIGSHPEYAEILRQVKPHKSDYGVRRTLQRYNLPPVDMAIMKRVAERWKAGFFSNDFLHLDIPYPGAAQFVNSLKAGGIEISYLTGRDVPRMFKGTVESLQMHGFPLEPDFSNLHLKPSAQITDHEFKKIFFEKMDLSHVEVFFYENEPKNVELVKRISPKIKIVFVDTVHSETLPIPKDVEHLIWPEK